MTEEKLTKKEVQDLLNFQGEIRGMDLKADAAYVLERDGPAALKKVEKKLKTIGIPLKYEEIKSMNFYSGGWRALSLIVIKEALGYDDQEIVKMGKKACMSSLIVKIFLEYFGSISRFFFKESPRLWSKYWTVGKVVPIELDEKEKVGRVFFKDINLHPLYCLYLKGYFISMIRMVTGGKNVVCEETKCFFKGDAIHEYSLKWK